MPILKNAKKALRSSQRKALVNRRVRSRAATALKVVRKEPTLEGVKAAFSAIDRAVKSHMFHRNKAARLKSQISKLLPAA